MQEDIKKEIGFNKEHEKISKTYKQIYVVIFKFTLPILGIIASFFVFNQLINGSYLQGTSIFPDKDKNQLQKENLVKSFEDSLNQKIANKDIKIQIILGKLYTKEDFIYSKDNLIKYKGYIMPKLFTISKTSPLSEITYFDSGTYNIQKLEEFIKNIIFIDNTNFDNKIAENQRLSIDQNLEKTFNLACLFKDKLIDKMCNYYIDEFLKYFFVHDIGGDIQGLKKIEDRLISTSKYSQFCEGIKKYIMYSNEPESNLKDIIQNCSNNQKTDEFNKIKNFIEIQKELNEGYIKDKYYSHKDLNSYKLLSFQQILYKDIKSNKVDFIRLNNYISFLKNLIKKNNIEQFYKEEMYRFNNYFLIKNLETIKEENGFVIIKDLYSINKGDKIFGTPGLIGQIKNKTLENYLDDKSLPGHNASTGLISGEQTSSILETLLQSLHDVSFLSITQSHIVGKDTIIVSGYLNIGDLEIKTDLLFQREQNTLLVKSINLQKYQSLTKLTNNLIQNEQRGINKVYQYINENIQTYGVEDEGIPITNIGVCDILKAGLNNALIECSSEKILIENQGINYKFFIKDEEIYNISISNLAIENQIKEQLEKTGYAKARLVETIQNIINYKLQEEPILSGNQNSILITEIFQKYLGIIPTDVVEAKGSLFLNFQLKNINFIAEFDMSNKNIKALYFQDIIPEGKPLNIKGFSLQLNDKNKSEINQFLINPIGYIKKLDYFAYINYENKFGEK